MPDGSNMMVEDGHHDRQARGQVLCEWDPHSIPILAEVGGKVRYEDIVEGETMRIEIDPSGHQRRTIIEHKGDLHPQVMLEDAERQDPRLLLHAPSAPASRSTEGSQISAGTLLAKTPREVSRHPGHHRRPAAGHRALRGPPAQGAGRHRRDRRPRRAAGARSGAASERSSSATRAASSASTWWPHGKYLRVHGGDRVRAGEALVDGPLVPHDILRISGEEAVQLPDSRDPERLSQPARRDRRQAPGDHRRADAAEGARRVGRRHHAVARLGHRQVRVPAPSQSGPDDVREDQGPRRHRLPPGRHRAARPLRAGEPPRRGAGAKKASGSGPSRPRPARSFWASPRRPCSPTASSRRPASRRRPRC